MIDRIFYILLGLNFLMGCQEAENQSGHELDSSEAMHQNLPEGDIPYEDYFNWSMKKIYNQVPLEKYDAQYTLVKSDTVTMKLDQTSFNFSKYPVYYDSGDVHYYIDHDEFTNSLNFYDLDKRKLVRKLNFSEVLNEGEHARTIYIKNLDSIYVYVKRKAALYLTDINLSKWEEYLTPDFLINHLNPTLESPFFVQGNVAVFQYMNFAFNRDLKDSLSLAFFDFEHDTSWLGGLHWGKALTDSAIGGTQSYPAIFPGHREGLLVYRYGALPLVITLDLKTRSKRVYKVRCMSQGEPYSYTEVDDFGDMVEGGRYEHYRDVYLPVMFDKYNQVYYSFFAKGIPPVDSTTGLVNDFESKQLSVMICDTNFRLLGETELEKAAYFRNFLVTRDGLLISNANNANPLSNDSTISFTLFNLKEVIEQ